MVEGKKNQQPTSSFVTGAIALVFLIIGYEVALFVHKAAVLRIAANRDHPDTVYVIERLQPEEIDGDTLATLGMTDRVILSSRGRRPRGSQLDTIIRKDAPHSPAVIAVREKLAPRRVESFRFNPNTVSVEDLQRLGFSLKQAQSIDNYRLKGGKFRRKTDFAKSFVVADSVYERLAPFIDIPLLDINKADSTALLSLPGIGPFFAGKVVQYRAQLGGFSTTEQLLEIWRFDQEKYNGLKDLITCSPPEPFALWTLSEADLARHPHISRTEAHAIVLYRTHHRPEECTVEGLQKAGVLSEEHAGKLSKCIISPAR
ncbi:MAG: helix-hairpin-helix domain-containing protein [Bacteroidales bacterium]|nr:helix-hairpin-helix domain-containing protein [Bacteroidales bacterium]